MSYGSFRELMWNLVFKVEFTELQKARRGHFVLAFY